MAELVGLNVKIGAEISDLQKAGKAVDTTLQGVTKSAEKTQAAFNALGSVQTEVSKSLATTAISAVKVDSSLQSVAKSVASIAPDMAKSALASNSLNASLDKLAAAGTAKLSAMADKALGLSPLLTNLSKNVAAFGGGVATNKIPDYFKKVAEETTKAGDALGSKVKPSSDRAGNALMNLGRIAQDAPFGFIGISNNINPLLESFQRLSKESGGVKGALQALGSSLLGGGGIGLAISVATGLMTVFSREIGKFASSLFDSEKPVNRFAEAHKNLVDVLNKGAESSGKEVVNLRVLEKVATDVAKPMNVRLQAVKDLQENYPQYLGNLTQEAILNGQAAGQINLVAAALRQRAIASAAAEKAGEVAGKQLDLELRRNFLINEQSKAQAKVNKLKAEATSIDLTGTGAINTSVSAVINEEKHLKELNTLLSKNSEAYKFNAEQIDFFTSKAAENADGKLTLEKPKKAPKTKDVKDVKDYTDVLRQLDEELKLNQKLADIGFISSAELDDAKIQRTKAAIESILKLKKGPGVDSPIITNLIGSMQPEEIRKQLGERSAEIAKTLKTIRPGDKELLSVNVPVDIKPVINTDRALSAIDQKIRDDFNNLAKDIQKTVLNSGLANIGETIGQAIAGGDVAGAFKGLLQTVISGMKQLGEAMIALGTAKIALEKFNLAPGIGTVIAGIGVIALSSLIQSALPKFEGGVTGFGGGLAIVGERGPEMVRLPQGSDVIPNHRMSGISGSGVQVFIPALTLRGSDLLVQFNRAQSQSNRRG